jgi:hypothetical protein
MMTLAVRLMRSHSSRSLAASAMVRWADILSVCEFDCLPFLTLAF